MKKRMVAAAAALLFLSGCGIGGGHSASISKEEQETDYSTVYAEIIEFGGFKNKEYESELNEQLEGDVRNTINEFDKLAQDAVEDLPAGVKSALNITQKVKRDSGDVISLLTENYIYLGGAHGTTAWDTYTIYLGDDNPHRLELKELFVDESQYIDEINQRIDRLVEDNPEQYSELWAQPHITEAESGRFYLTDNDLVIWFPPYELSYYARGFVEFPIPLSELNGLLKEEFRVSEK